MLYPVILNAMSDDAPQRAVACAMLLDISRPSTSPAPVIGVAAFSYLDFPKVSPEGEAATDTLPTRPYMAVAINSVSIGGRFPTLASLCGDRADLGISPADETGVLRLSFSSEALLDGSILHNLLATTDLPDPSAAALNAGGSEAVSYLVAHGLRSSYAMVWKGSAADPQADICPRALPCGAGVEVLVNSGGPAAIVGCWGGHLLSLGMLAPFALNFNDGLPFFTYTHGTPSRRSHFRASILRISPFQIVPHLPFRGELVSDMEHMLFREVPMGRSGGGLEGADVLQRALGILLDTGERQVRVPASLRLPSGTHRVAEPSASTLCNQRKFLDVSRAFDGTAPEYGREVYPMSQSFLLPRGADSPAPRDGLLQQLGYMFSRMGSNNPFVADIRQNGTRNTPLFDSVYGSFTEDADIVSDMVRNMLLRCCWDTLAGRPYTGVARFPPMPEYTAMSDLMALLKAAEREMPQTILANHRFPQRDIPQVSTTSIGYTMQTAVVTMAAVHVMAIDRRVNGERPPRLDEVVTSVIAMVDGHMDSLPFESACGMVGDYSNKICNWLQGAATTAGRTYVRRCLVDGESRDGLISIIASSLRGLLGPRDEDRRQALNAQIAARMGDSDEMRVPLSVAPALSQSIAAAHDRAAPEGDLTAAAIITDEGRRHIAAAFGRAASAFAPEPRAEAAGSPVEDIRREAVAAATARALGVTRDAAETAVEHMARLQRLAVRDDAGYDSMSARLRGNGRLSSPSRGVDHRQVGYFGTTVASRVGERLAANDLTMACRIDTLGPDVAARLRSGLSGSVECEVNVNAATRATEIRIDVPIRLRFSAEISDEVRFAIHQRYGQEQVDAILAELLEGLLTHRLFTDGSDTSAINHSAGPRGDMTHRVKPRTQGASTAATTSKKRRIVIPEGGDKS